MTLPGDPRRSALVRAAGRNHLPTPNADYALVRGTSLVRLRRVVLRLAGSTGTVAV